MKIRTIITIFVIINVIINTIILNITTIITINVKTFILQEIKKVENMNGETTKYYKYDSSGSGTVTIPIALAKALNWSHGDKINIVFETRENQSGLFLFKKKKE